MEEHKRLKIALASKEQELEKAKSEIDLLKVIIESLKTDLKQNNSDNALDSPTNQSIYTPYFRCDSTGNIISSTSDADSILMDFNPNNEPLSAKFFVDKVVSAINSNEEYFNLNFSSKDKTFNFFGIKEGEIFEVKIQEITRIKEIELQALKNQSRYQQIIENASDIIFRCNTRGFFTYVNPVAIKLLGFSEEELLQMHFTQLIRKDHQERVEKFYINQVKDRTSNTYLEFPALGKNGQEFFLSQSVQLVLQDDEVIEITAIARDITEKKKNQDALSKLSNRFTAIVAKSDAGIIVTGENGIVENLNKQFTQIFFPKKRHEDLIGMQIDRLLYQIALKTKDPASFRTKTKDDMKFEKSVHQRLIELSDGRFLRYDFFPLIDGDLNSGYFWFFRDVTEEQEVQKAIRRSEEKYRGILENLELGIMEVDNNETIISVNQRFCDMLGYAKPEKIIGKRTIDILLPEGKAIDILRINEERKSGKSGVYEFSIRNVYGNTIPLLISGAPIYDENGQIIGSIGLHMDMTQQKEFEHELEEAKLKAEASSKSKEVFLAHMSHEIRTPMNAIIGMAGLLSQSNLSSKQKVYLDAIRTSSNNLLNIINDILDFSKIEAGKLTLETVGFQPDLLIKNTIGSISHLAAGKSILINVQLEKNVPKILLGDPLRINQILINLLSNAIKFTPEGRVSLSASYTDKNNLILSVTDTGIGIDEEKLQVIFESFTQADNSISRKFGGTGLGLTITRQLTELMGGSITVDSKIGMGTTFKVTIPLNKGNDDDVPISTKTSLGNLQKLVGLKILLVEDNTLNQFLATTVLESKGLQVDIADNGTAAINKLKNHTFDLILMDIQMPIMGGLEATQIIRNELGITTPIIALTAKAIKGDEQMYLEAGMDGYLSKPFEPEQLVNAVANIIQLPDQIEIETNKIGSITNSNYNLDKIKGIAAGNGEFERKMVTLFVTNTPNLLKELTIGLADKDFDKVYNVVHQLKPSIDLFQIESLTQIIRNIEDSARYRKHLEDIDLLSDKLILELTLCIDLMKKEFDL